MAAPAWRHQDGAGDFADQGRPRQPLAEPQVLALNELRRPPLALHIQADRLRGSAKGLRQRLQRHRILGPMELKADAIHHRQLGRHIAETLAIEPRKAIKQGL